MTNCKQIPLPKIGKEDLQKIISFFSMGNHLFNERYVLGDTGQFDNFMRFHNKQTSIARDNGVPEEEYPTYEESFNTYEIIRNSR